MFKKFISMSTAVIVSLGVSVVSSSNAFATPTISLGSISATPVAGTVSTASIAVTTVDIPDMGGFVLTWVTDSSGSTSASTPTGITKNNPMILSSAATITFTVGNTAAAGNYYLKVAYGIATPVVATLTVAAAQQSNNSSSSSSSDSIAAAAAAAAKAVAEKVAAAKVTLVDSLKTGKPITAANLNAADLSVASTKAAERVVAKIQTLPEADRTDLSRIKIIVERENFVEKVSTSATQLQVSTRDLVRVGLVAPDYGYKSAVVRSLLAIDPTALASIEKVEAAVKEAQAAVQARKDRLSAIIAKINGTK